MKKLAMLAAAALTVLAVLGLTGCIQVHSDTVITKDGSGTATFSMSMSPTVLQAIKDMTELDMNQAQDIDVPMFEDINKKDLENAAKGHGVKITKFDKGLIDGREQLDIAMDFDDLESLSYVMGELMGGNEGDGMGIYRTADGNYVLKQAHYDYPDQPAGEAEEADSVEETEGGTNKSTLTDEEKAQKQMEVMGKMMGAMAELDVRFTITVPGEIIQSNAPTVEGKTSIWAINADNMMTQKDNEMDPVIKFSSKGLKIKALEEDE